MTDPKIPRVSSPATLYIQTVQELAKMTDTVRKIKREFYATATAIVVITILAFVFAVGAFVYATSA